MPRKKSESPIKEDYRLWWEYLKLSKDYKEFCKWMDKRSKDPSLPIPRQGNWFELWDGYMFFGNIHVNSFEEWWKRNKDKLGKSRGRGFPGPIEDYTDFVMLDMDDVIEEFKRTKGREPSIEEFKKSFFEKLNFPVSRFYFMVSLFGDYRFGDLGKQFIKILKEKKKQHTEIAKKRGEEYWRSLEKKLSFHFVEAKAGKYDVTWAGRWQYRTAPIRRKELGNYLEIYKERNPVDKTKRPTISQIAKKIYPQEEGKKEVDNPERIIYEILEKAEKIITNAECGVFPGNY